MLSTTNFVASLDTGQPFKCALKFFVYYVFTNIRLSMIANQAYASYYVTILDL